MPEEEAPPPVEREPPGPQPDDPPTEGTEEGPGVDETSDDSFPASDPPSW